MAGTSPIAANRKILAASLVGTAIEYYDFYIYATAASLVLGPLFFPSTSPSAALLLSFSTLALAFFARPIGAAIFGHFGDRIGRKSTLVASLLLMGLCTTFIAFLPTYAQAGVAAPILLCLLRVGQGLGLGGEWGGATLLAAENAPPGWRGRFNIFPQMGPPVGFVIATSVFLVINRTLTPEQFQAWGWRLPFLGSIVLVVFGLWVRLKLAETPAFAKIAEREPPPRVPLATLFANHAFGLFGGTMVVVVCMALYYLATAFTVGYGNAVLKIDKNMLLEGQLIAAFFMGLGVVCAGFLTDKRSAREVLIAGCGLAAAVGLMLAPALNTHSFTSLTVFTSAALLLCGFTFGAVGAYLPELFPATVRYTGVSIAWNVGAILGGGFVPLFALKVATTMTNGLTYIGWYLSGCAVVSCLAAIGLKKVSYKVSA
jgi:MFS family permease